ncbi:MAG: glycosyltransferase, partial [Candidatus Omnitrophica bacterium]|nr:glycosyltransferase [Candidatus Omnitrophota bacterium]
MSTCNGECYLRDCIESVLEQSLPGFEFLIIDDCSRDSSVRIIRSYSDSRIKLIGQNRENKGLFYGLNELIRHSSSELIKVWSQDDIMLRSCLEEGVSFHEKHPEAGCFYTSYYIIDSKGDIIQKLADDNKVFVLTQEEGDKFLLTCGSVCGNISTLFFLKEVFKNVGYFKEDCISGDFEMMVRTLSKYKIALINKPLMKLRRHKR